MRGTTPVRRIATLAVTLHVVLALLGLHLHGFPEAPAAPVASAAIAGDGPQVACPGDPCHDPSHDHRHREGHDPASCSACVVAARLGVPEAVGGAALPPGEAGEPVFGLSPPRWCATSRRVHPARGPPGRS
jgi:hypothetical protein